MFKTSMAQRVFMQNKTPLVFQPMKRFQQYGPGPYKSGLERTLEDKFIWANAQMLSGMGFVFWGICNVGVYGLSKVMTKESFDYHF